MPNQAKGRFVVLGQEDLRAALDSEGLIGVLDPGSVLGEEVEALLGHQPEAEAVKVDRPLVALQLQLDVGFVGFIGLDGFISIIFFSRM